MAVPNGKNPTVLQMDIIDKWAQGFKEEDICALLKCSRETVRSVKKSEQLRKIFYERQNAQIVELLPLAVQRLKGLLESNRTQATVLIAAIREVFDRSHLTELMDNTDKDIKITVTYE